MAAKDGTKLIAGRHVIAYEPATAFKLMELIAEGKTVSAALKEPNMPSRATFYRWLIAYPDLNTAYEAARELSAQAFEEEALDMARTLKGDNAFTAVKVRMYEVAMQQLRWSASHRDPKRYGQKQEASLIVPIQINTSLNLDAGPVRQITHDSVYKLEAVVVKPLEPGEFTPPDDAEELVSDIPPVVKPGKNRTDRLVRLGKHKTTAQIRATVATRNRGKARKETPDGTGTG